MDISSAPIRQMIATLVRRRVSITSTLAVFETLTSGASSIRARPLSWLRGYRTISERSMHGTRIRQRPDRRHGADCCGRKWNSSGRSSPRADG